jgi:hypothetical protein
MKAAIALIFFACVAGSMAANPTGELVQNLLQQGQTAIQSIVNTVQTQVLGLVQQALGQLSAIVGTIGGRFDLNFNELLANFQSALNQLANQAVGSLLGGLSSLIGGNGRVDVVAIFNDFLASISGAVTGLGQHLLNQGLGAVLGGLGGSRAIGDIFASLSQQIGAAVTAAQGAFNGVVGSLASLGSGLLDASKPHWQELQSQLVGHGLNVLGSVSETINNLHGTVTGGR